VSRRDSPTGKGPPGKEAGPNVKGPANAESPLNTSSHDSSGHHELHVPDIGPDDNNLAAALKYADAGWHLLPVQVGSKHPGSVVGKRWQAKSSRDAKRIAAWFVGTDYGIALHCGRSGAVAFDVDHGEYLPDVLVPHLEQAPFQCTRPDDPQRGHYVYAMPAGRTIGNSAGRLSGGWGEVRGLNGVIIVQPTPHHDGGRYRWQRTGAVPVLPDEIAELLDDASPVEDAATDAVVTTFIDEHTSADRPDVLQGLVSTLLDAFDVGKSRHQSTVSVLAGAMKEARIGLYSAREAIDVLKPMFTTAAMKPPVSVHRGAARSATEAESEFAGILAWAIGQALGADIGEIRKRVNEKMPDNTPSNDGPIPLTSSLIDVPPFPVDAFPTVYANKVNELAEATQTDSAMAATSALATLSACVGGHAKIQVRPGWVEPLCLYTNTIARPGERKSAVQSSMTRPLHDAEVEMSIKGEVERLKLADELDMAKKKVDQLNKAAVNGAAKAAKSDATDQDRSDAEKAAQAARDAKSVVRDIQVPVIPRLLADDITPEATASLLADHGGRIAIISAEGGIFDTIAGRYARTVNLDVFLKGHSGEQIRVDRQGRPPQYIRNPALTMGLMVQPRIIEAIAANRDFVGRGLLARFLYATPVSKVGFRTIGADPVKDTTEAQYCHDVKKLASDMARWQGDPAILMLHRQAETEVRRIEKAVEATLAGEGELASPSTLTEWGSKYVGAVVRIAGLLHLAEHGQKGYRYPVQPETIRAAERIGDYFKAAAINVFSQMGSTPDTADAMYLLTVVERIKGDAVSEREMFTASSRPRFPTKADMMPALRRLIEHGYLIPQETPKPTGGRPASPRYKIHRLTAQAAQAAQGRP
jgi:replicative DNA helicase